MTPPSPSLSVVVVAYDMARELPRTLRTLAPGYQRGVEAADLEVVVVDNGSPTPIAGTDLAALEAGGVQVRLERIDPAPPSPAAAANRGLELAGGDLVGLIVDGARLASPGLLATALLAARLADRPVITAPGFHLGAEAHMRAAEVGYDQRVEDDLLAATGWETDGYELFGVSTLAGSSGRGVFGPMGESSSLFLRASAWRDLGGLDERFVLPGGGLVNHDLYRRACSLPDAELVVLLGEGTFHQYHGGAATSRRFTWDEMHAEYQGITGAAHEPPANRPLFVGTVPGSMLGHLERSVAWAQRHGPSAPPAG